MIDLSVYHNTLWLADPSRLQRLAIKAASYERCFTTKEVVRTRKKWTAHAGRLADEALASTGVDLLTESQMEAPKAIRATKGKVGVIPIHGPVDQRMSSELMKAGGTPLDFVSAAFDSLMNNAAVGSIVLHIDSPGGSSYGTEELSTKIYNARGKKPVYAIADSVAASAAYWLATSASLVCCTPGGEVGSVGVYAMHVDKSKALAEEGLSITMVSAGKYKTEYASIGPLSDEARANLQDSVDGTYSKFLGALARNRAVSVDDVRKNYGQGRCFSADKALSVGMIDRIISFDDLISRLTGGDVNSVRSTSPSAETEMELIRLREEEHRHRRGRAI